MKAAIVIPVYNEEKYLPRFLKHLLSEVKKLPQISKLIFVNDGSTDQTLSILNSAEKRNKKIMVLSHKKNLGKGHAMKTGSQEALNKKAKQIIYMDGDGQHDPKHLKEFIQELKKVPLVFGYRQLKKDTPLIRKVGNNISSFIIKNVFRIDRIGDVLCGYFAIRSDIYKEIKWRSNDYGVEAEISTIISQKMIPFKEILVKTIYLDHAKGVNISHALNIFMRIPFWALSRHINKVLKYVLPLGLMIVFLLLAYKDPFSSRSLVPNLEPYPDTLFYSNPAWNFVHGNGFMMKAFDYQSKIITPPIYSLYLIPFFGLFGNVRSFYFGNLILMLASLGLFMVIARKLLYDKLPDVLIVGLVGYFFATNFFFYSQPYLLMAESITLLFSMLAVYFLVSPITAKRSFWAGLLGLGILMIKFSNLPLAAAFYALYALRLYFEPSKKSRQTFGLSFALSALLFLSYLVKTQIFSGHKNLSSGAGFSPSYFLFNFQQYLRVLAGERERYLWFDYRMLSPLLIIPSVVGMIAGLLNEKWRRNTLLLLTYGLSVIVFMSFFYTRDIRYIIPVFPIMLLFTGMAFVFIKERLGKVVSVGLMVVLLAAHLILPNGGQIPDERQIITMKKQVGLNFRHAEEPWNYKAVIEFNSYFNKQSKKKPYLGTLLPPYFVNFYANGNYNYLPVSMGQEFFGDKQNAPKVFTTSLTDYYKQLLNDGNEIYVSPYYQANLKSWKTDYENLTKEFSTTLVKEGCFNTCNIYRLTLLPFQGY